MFPGVVINGEADVCGALDEAAGWVVVPSATGTTGCSVGEPVVSTRLWAWC
jgi:hypothetical protein